MNDSVNKRPRYFDGQYLQDVDFQTEQNYHIDRQRRFARLLTVSGIAEGLTCEASVSNGGSAGIELQGTSIEDIFFTVRKGTAIDAQGRQIVLLQDRINIQIKQDSSGDKILYIKYSDAPSSEDMQGSNETRVTEEPEIGFVDNIDNDNGTHIPLAKVAIQDRKFGGLDFKIREYSGISLPTPSASPNGDNQTSVTLRSVNNQEYTRLAELAGSLSITGNVGIGSLPGNEQLRVQGDSAFTGSLSVSQTTTLEGNVGIGGSPGNEQLRVQGNSAITGALAVANTTTLTGNVGIGGAPGNERLKVHGNSAITGSLSVGNSTTLIGNVGIGGSSGNEQLRVQGNSAIIGTLSVANTTTLTGNVGVGGAPGNKKLKVQGNAEVIGSLNIHGGNSSTSRLTIETPEKYVGEVARWETQDYPGNYYLSMRAINPADFDVAWSFTQQSGSGSPNIFQNLLTLRKGKVGIGTIDPRSELEVNGRLCINALRFYNGDSSSQYWEVRPNWNNVSGISNILLLNFYFKGGEDESESLIGMLEANKIAMPVPGGPPNISYIGNWRNKSDTNR